MMLQLLSTLQHTQQINLDSIENSVRETESLGMYGDRAATSTDHFYAIL